MVAFCESCNHSLPFANVLIRDGQEEPLPDDQCPHCGEQAGKGYNGTASDEGKTVKQLVIKNGNVMKTTGG